MAGIYKPSGRAGEYSLLAVNHYTGCPHRCEYCYVPLALHIPREEFHKRVEPRKDILMIVGKQAARLAGTDRRVMLSFACDPYPGVEARLKVTRDILKILVKNDVPFQVLTKAGQLAYRDFDLYRRGLDAFAVTLTTLDDETATEIEPGAAPPSERMEMLRAAHDRGIETWVSLEPVIQPMESITAEQWREFGRRVMDACVGSKTAYYIKQDLAGYIGDFPLGNTDNRKVTRCIW